MGGLAGLALRLVVEPRSCDPVWDAAVSHALMVRVAAGEVEETVRLSRPNRAVAFGKRDVIAPGYADAVAHARAAGFEGVERLAGGRASAFHEGTLHLGHAVASADARTSVTARFDHTAELVAAALGRLGIDARVGEVAGEYCPGAHSVNARGAVKLAGLAQRVVAGGAYLGGVVVVEDAALVRTVLAPVYSALELDWRPQTTGAIADEAPGSGWEDVAAALAAECRDRLGAEPGQIDAGTLALADQLLPEHLSSPARTSRPRTSGPESRAG